MFYLCMFHCIVGLVASTVSEWSTLSCLIAVTFLSLRCTRFPATPEVSIPGLQEQLLFIIIIIIINVVVVVVVVVVVAEDY